MIDDLLPSEHLRDQLAVIRCSLREPHFTLALLELSSWIDGHRRRMGNALSVADQALINDVLRELDAANDILAARMSRTACLYSEHRSVLRDRFVVPTGQMSPHSWKPEGVWTSPLVQQGNSAWSLRAASEGDTKLHPYNLLLAHPEASRVSLLETLADADLLLASHGGRLELALESLRADGYAVVDFSWRCVLEAEVSVLRGERYPVAFPCGLGVECSLWLELPSDPIGIVEIAHPSSRGGQETGWFEYE